MEIRKLVGIIGGVIISTSCSAYEFKKSSEFTLFKNYALSSCVATHYKNETIYKDAIDALNGSREFGNISLDAYHEINKILPNWSKKEYKSKAGNISEFFMCIDFHNSEDISNIFDRYNPCKKPENWDSKEKFEKRCK